MKNQHALAYEKLEEYIKTINPNFKDINFDFLGSKLFLVLREQYLSKSVSIEHISDGTLRHLLFLSIFLNPERGSMICIDEPENGLHPDMINTIAKLIKEAANGGTQLIIATHSPLLLNSFELDDVLIFEKESGNQTAVHVKSEEEFESWNEDFLVGQLWLRGLIGGKRW
jgi:predicted ATPase